ncbi:MAG: glycosyltransferase [Candidatus Helarchaeota archaeon]
MGTIKNIAIFQANYALKTHTINLVNMLTKAGYSIDLFLFGCSNKFEKIASLNCNIYDFSLNYKSWNEYDRKIDKIIVAFKYFILDPLIGEERIIPQKIISDSLEIINKRNYICFIGIEKMGLIWAGRLCEKKGTPIVIYYSLELYSNSMVKHMKLLKSFRFLKVRKLEAKYHRKAIATIIQDLLRAKEILHYNKVKKSDIINLPISILGKPKYNKSIYLRKILNIDENKKIILQFGQITKNRLSDKIAQAAQSLPEEFVLVFHGLASEPNTLKMIKSIDVNNRIIISTSIVPSEKLNDLISSANIGLCFYNNKNKNDILAGFSSEKLARYLRCGIPVIAFDYPSFYNSVEKNHCGICISSLTQLPEAINKIFQNYNYYRKNAFKTYKKHFEFSAQSKQVITYINEIGSSY